MFLIFFMGFGDFYDGGKCQKWVKSRNHRGACKQGCLRCPLGSRPGLQGYSDEAGACRTGVFKCPGDN